MRKTFAAFVLALTLGLALTLVMPSIALAQVNETDTTNTTTTTVPQVGTFRNIYNLLANANPILLLVFGIILLLASHLSKYIAYFLIIVALIQIVLPIL